MTVHGMHRKASIDINVSQEAVYALASDLPRMGEWSPENIVCYVPALPPAQAPPFYTMET